MDSAYTPLQQHNAQLTLRHSTFADNKYHVIGCDAVQPAVCQHLLPKSSG